MTGHRPEDFDGDGRADLFIVRSIAGFKYFFIRLASGGSRVIQLGLSSDQVMAGHYSGRKNAEVAAVRISSSRPNPQLSDSRTYFILREGKMLWNAWFAWLGTPTLVVRPDGLGVR